MVNNNLLYAPQPKMVDGLLAVPIDIQTIVASLTFDASTQTAFGDATINYITGIQNGYPVFDLRQTITAAWVDGAPIPIANLVSHDFGGGAHAEMRIINVLQTANTNHTLRVQYALAAPNVPIAGSYQPQLIWNTGPRLVCNFGFSDLGAGRYLESWVPANLIYDQFQLTLEVEITNSPTIAHTIITNGVVSNLGINHWRVDFPSHFTALSMLVEIRAMDTLVNHNDTVLLPVSGTVVTIEGWKIAASADDLLAYVNNIKTYLTENENTIGSYMHGNRFVAFVKGSMEYEGGITSGGGPLRHECHHSWWARGVKPARQQDGWWDEGWTVYHDNGSIGSTPFNFANTPIVLCSENEWQRITPNNAYSDGEVFWEGIASLLGVSTLQNLMREFYTSYKGKLAATYDFETFLLCKTGNTQLVNAFHRFAYGYVNPSPAPDLWLRDNTSDPGNNNSSGVFWNSPDLWIRNENDDGTFHQSPEYGQDNWFYARVKNRSASAIAKHFVVTFNPKTYAGTQFTYASDFLPCVAAVAGFNLGPGETRIVKAKWPKTEVPPTGTHSCLLASVLTVGDFPLAGAHVWEHNNLAQKNLTIVDMKANDDFIIIPFVIANLIAKRHPEFYIELLPDKKVHALEISLLHNHKSTFLKPFTNDLKEFDLHLSKEKKKNEDETLNYDHMIHSHDKLNKSPGVITSSTVSRLRKFFPGKLLERYFLTREKHRLLISIHYSDQYLFALKIRVTEKEKKGDNFLINVIQRQKSSKKIIGGIAVQLNIK